MHADEQGDTKDTLLSLQKTRNIIMIHTNEHEYTPFLSSHSRVSAILQRSLVTAMVRESVSPSSGFPGL